MIGFSTGCLYKNLDPISKEAVEIIVSIGCDAIELGAGEKRRVYNLSSISKESLSRFEYVSLHAPDDLVYDDNEETREVLREILENHERLGFDCVVIHPDTVVNWKVFDDFDLPIAFENVDIWKDFGKSVEDMKKVFTFGDYKMVCDLTHAYTIDSSMGLARDLQKEFVERIRHIHLSGYHCFGGDSQKHYPLYLTKQKEILDAVMLDRPIIIESVLPKCSDCDEVEYMKDCLAKELNYVNGFLFARKDKGSLKEDALEYHRAGDKNRAGKIGTDILSSVKGKEDLTLAYSPGVAAPCLEIVENPKKIYEYTNKGNTVAVVSNGSAVLGLGNIGAAAGKPVMEGKALLFKHFADVDARDVLVDSQNPDDIIEVVRLISPTYGGINLEDIKAPECFYVEEKLKEILDIPVFHDDQHGTAIVVGAGLINALKISGKNIEDVKVVFSGAGAAGIACAKMVVELGVKKENLIMCDSKGVVYAGREADDSKKEFAIETSMRELREVVEGADVFIGVSKRDILTPEMLMSMNESPVVFAMANPNPEIDYDLAKMTRGDVIMATGRSDYPNQVNNVLGFPGIFRGALDVRARCINEEMKIAAVWALAGLVDEPNKDFIIPSPFDDGVVVEVAFAVAKAAIESGVADSGFDLVEYRKKLEERFLREGLCSVKNYMVIGITGMLGAGKEAIVEYLLVRGFKHYSVRTYLVEEIKRRKLEINRDSMVLVANDLRKKYGSGYIVEELYKMAEAEGGNCVIESIRCLGEVAALRKKRGFVLFGVDADIKTRYSRVVGRGTSTDDVSFEEFVFHEQRESTSIDTTKGNLRKCIELADYNFRNDSTIVELHERVGEVLDVIDRGGKVDGAVQ